MTDLAQLTHPVGPTPAADAEIRCLVVDDHPAVRLGLAELLRVEPGIRLLDAVSSAEAALAFAEEVRVDVAVVDYQLTGHSGLWLCRKLKRLAQPPAVLIYSAFSDYLLAAASVVAQADGLVSKAALGSVLCDRVREASLGVSTLPGLPPTLQDSLRHRLDPGQQAIYGLLAAGVDTTEIAATLGRSAASLESELWTMLRTLERVDARG